MCVQCTFIHVFILNVVKLTFYVHSKFIGKLKIIYINFSTGKILISKNF